MIWIALSAAVFLFCAASHHPAVLRWQTGDNADTIDFIRRNSKLVTFDWAEPTSADKEEKS